MAHVSICPRVKGFEIVLGKEGNSRRVFIVTSSRLAVLYSSFYSLSLPLKLSYHCQKTRVTLFKKKDFVSQNNEILSQNNDFVYVYYIIDKVWQEINISPPARKQSVNTCSVRLLSWFIKKNRRKTVISYTMKVWRSCGLRQYLIVN